MGGNTQAQFTRQANLGSGILTTANTKSDGAGTIATDIIKCFTADATNGSYVEFVRIMPVSSVAATATAATVVRIFWSSLTSGTTSSANTSCIAEVAIPAVTADQTTTAINPYDVPLGFRLPASYTILATTHIVNTTNTSWKVSVFGGDY